MSNTIANTVCPYCEADQGSGRISIQDNHNDTNKHELWILDDTLRLWRMGRYQGGYEINFCPICGRRLSHKLIHIDNRTRSLQSHYVVQVRLFSDSNAKRYAYNVPESLELHKGDIVRVRNKDGKEAIAFCVTDSEHLSDNAVDMLMSGQNILSNVIGKYTLQTAHEFQKIQKEENNE